MNTKANDSASPLINSISHGTLVEIVSKGGLTKHEFFSAMAMQGYLASTNGWTSASDLEEAAKRSVIASRALIKALNETPNV